VTPVRLIPATPEWEEPLAQLFDSLREAGDERFFHPHPLTRGAAHQVAAYRGSDAYYVLIRDTDVLGYGMLRGWDAGYAVPSLGMALHPSARGQGLGRTFMELLHDAARTRGARRVRLKVYPENEAARTLYERLGYVFSDFEEGQLVGSFDLNGGSSS
jgi:[ribosomal protein S18]-alanine N-acetyltransferase